MSSTTIEPAGEGRARPLAVAGLVAAALFWAGNIVVGKLVAPVLGPVSLLFWRWAIAVVPLLVIAVTAERPRWREVLRSWWLLVLLAGTGMCGYGLLLYAALQYTDVVNASLINAFNPALIAVAAAVFLRERLRATELVGIGIALVGVLVVLTRGDLAGLFRIGYGTGDLLMVLAICSWTAYTVLGRRVRHLPPITVAATQAVIAVLVLAPVVALTGLNVPTSAGAVCATLFIALFPSVLSYLFWNRGVLVVGAARAGAFMNLITLFAIPLSLATGATLDAPQLAGGLVVLTGVAITSLRARRA
ncbi:DMT family transporter [Streptomyces sp. FH025]|uniref:DMT family transporter n=1 Tax=Streptomyces sp. FH025 TaxID=2815937 RepID=UPI001A9F4FE3|nr:DMT family transporter [Streptomyces sp. FH025]MBO1419926.1 DMT family transporter [Streptomyces sp. FH025]